MFDNFRFETQNRWPNSRQKHHRHKNNNLIHNKMICEHFECISSLNGPEVNRRAYIIKPPPLFNLPAPPSPLELIDKNDDPSLFHQVLDITRKKNLKPSIKYNITKHFEDYIYERRPYNFNFNKNRISNDLSNSSATPAISISSTSPGVDTNVLNWFLIFGMALLTVILLFVIFYVFLKR